MLEIIEIYLIAGILSRSSDIEIVMFTIFSSSIDNHSVWSFMYITGIRFILNSIMKIIFSRFHLNIL